MFHHLPLERYKQRYTEFLRDWESIVFKKYMSDYEVYGSNDITSIKSGEVIDSVARPVYAMNQLAQLLPKLTADDSIYLSDFYHTGVDGIRYSRIPCKLYSFCWAQSFDIYDFTRQFMPWIRQYELMMLEMSDTVFVACSELKELIISPYPEFTEKIEVVGLPFNSQFLINEFGNGSPFFSRDIDCVFTSRFDLEKNPWFFLDLAESRPELQFAICTGWENLKGTAVSSVERAKSLRNLTIYNGLDKAAYYNVLKRSRVQFNCAMQDWVSFTLLEALTFGCNVLYPNFRAFPSVLHYSFNHLYKPHSLSDANQKLNNLMAQPPKNLREYVLTDHDKSIERIANRIQSNSNLSI